MADVTIESVSAVVAQIYEAAYDQERWIDVVERLRDLLKGSRACIVRLDPKASDAVSTVYDPEFASLEVTAAHMRDPISTVAVALPVGQIYDRTRIIDHGADFRRRELWQQWYRPRDMHHGLAFNLWQAKGSYWFFDVHRGAKQDPFGSDDMDLLQKFMPHILRAGQISQSLENTSALASAFSHLPVGVFLVNGHQKVVQMNEAAEALLARPDSPLVLNSGTIAAFNIRDEQELQRLVVDACSSLDTATPGTGGTLMVPSYYNRSDLARLVLSVAPFVDGRAYGMASERRAVIMVTEVLRRTPDGFEEHVRGLFDLTAAEARLATALAAGRTLKEAAAGSNIKVKSSRTYLERIFSKTHTRQQSELVALLKSTEPLSRPGR